MKINNIDVSKTVTTAKELLEKEKGVSPALKSVIKLLFVIVEIFLNRLSLNSKNSSKPPASDPNRKRQRKEKASKRKPGGQTGHVGKQLKQVANPDEIKYLKIDRRKLPKDIYSDAGFEKRQVVDYKVLIHITEYRAEILENSKGEQYIADFPMFVKRPIQYGVKMKASSVYMSQFQMTPYNRIVDYFSEQVGLQVSAGSLFNFNKEAYGALERFESIAKEKLIASRLLHADETGININGKRIWLHTACNDKWTHFFPHIKRGCEAIDAIGILPNFKGILCHDHWKPYYRYNCEHALCNAHHLRELEWSATEDQQKWAEKMRQFLLEANKAVTKSGGKLSRKDSKRYGKQYDELLIEAEKECPDPKMERKAGQRGRLKKSKSRNLLERLISYKQDVLRFMDNSLVPFTNNQGENDLRMTKVQQKISGCFRSDEGALIFCRIRSYLNTCRKQGISATAALQILFEGKLPNFIDTG